MKGFLGFLVLGIVGLSMMGCGPLQAPMAPRLDAQGQKSIDEAWERALQPVDRFGHQALLDALMLTKAYESGVDKLTFRSEKRVAAGTVIMEVHYDRVLPAEDRFDVRLVDANGRVLRQERYSREEVERTYHELFVEREQLQQSKAQGMATPAAVRALADYEARLEAVGDVFPTAAEDRDANARRGPR